MRVLVDFTCFWASKVREMGRKKSQKTVAEVRTISDGRAKKRKYQTIPLAKKEGNKSPCGARLRIVRSQEETQLTLPTEADVFQHKEKLHLNFPRMKLKKC